MPCFLRLKPRGRRDNEKRMGHIKMRNSVAISGLVHIITASVTNRDVNNSLFCKLTY